MLDSVVHLLKDAPGDIAFYYENLVTGETFARNADAPLLAASVIKLPIMVAAFQSFAAGARDPLETIILAEEDKVPSCGALTYMQSGLEVRFIDLVTLMIILSDNTATNMVIDRLGVAAVNRAIAANRLAATRLERKMFDMEAAAQGKQNRVSARDMGSLLAAIYRGEAVSQEASAQMLQILKSQRLNGKMPFYLHELGIKSAHKTGEDDGITHDVGIVFAKEPFIACFLSNNTDVPRFERIIQEATGRLAGAL